MKRFYESSGVRGGGQTLAPPPYMNAPPWPAPLNVSPYGGGGS